MENKDKERFATIMIVLAENFSSELSDKSLEMFFNLAKNDDISINQWEESAHHLLRTRKYTKMPTYADFYETIKGTQADIAEKQAHLVIMAVRGDNKVFDDPITQHLMTTRWWVERLKETMVENEEHFFVRDFKVAYLAYSNTKDSLKQIETIPKDIKQIVDKIGG